MRSIVSTSAHPLLQPAAAPRSAERPAAAVDEEARAVGGVDHALAHRLAGRAGAARSTRSPDGVAGDDLEQPHHRRRVEEVHADHALGCVARRGDRGDRQRRGVRRQHAVLADDLATATSNSSCLSSSDSGAASMTRSQSAQRVERRRRLQARAARRPPPPRSRRPRSTPRARWPCDRLHAALAARRRPGRAAACARRPGRRAGRCRRPSCRRRRRRSSGAGPAPLRRDQRVDARSPRAR